MPSQNIAVRIIAAAAVKIRTVHFRMLSLLLVYNLHSRRLSWLRILLKPLILRKYHPTVCQKGGYLRVEL